MEFAYKDDANIHAFVCQRCGVYNYFDKDEVKNLEVIKMEKFQATKVSDDGIELTNSDELDRLYSLLQKEEDFILEWKEGEVAHSKVMIGNNLSAKIKTGDLSLTAKQGLKGE